MDFSRGFSRSLGPALLACSALAVPASAVTPSDPHAEALAALTATQATVDEISKSEDSFSTDPETYRGAAQHAINILVGKSDPLYVADAGEAADPVGAIGHLDGLLNDAPDAPWVNPVRGAEINLRASVARLQAARKAHELMDYQLAATEALTSLGTAIGRGSDPNVLGGLLGALANTTLGVPKGAREVDACAAPTATAPAYGTHGGYLSYVAVPMTAKAQALPDTVTASAVAMQGGAVLLSTPAAAMVAKLCAAGTDAPQPAKQAATAVPSKAAAPLEAQQQAASQPQPESHASSAESGSVDAHAPSGDTMSAEPAKPAAPPPQAAAAQPPPAERATQADGGLPALYTLAQAQAGRTVYMQQCVSCHGADLHGVAAPAIAGSDFLKSAKDNEWSLEVIRYLVFTMMPLNAGGSLQPKQYAEVMAFLLASNCFPAGAKPFPEVDEPGFEKVQLQPVSGEHPGENAQGVCPVH